VGKIGEGTIGAGNLNLASLLWDCVKRRWILHKSVFHLAVEAIEMMKRMYGRRPENANQCHSNDQMDGIITIFR
jgi:hypothetical protein